MQQIYFWARIISIVSFAFYGISCVIDPRFVFEFDRYGLKRFRVIVGILEIMGSLGLVVGYYFPPLTFFAALGLAAMMICGIGVRIKIRDSVLQMLPALFYLVLNLLIVFLSKDFL